MREEREPATSACTPQRKVGALLVLVAASVFFVWMVVWPLARLA